jgi:hypothetical protein
MVTTTINISEFYNLLAAKNGKTGFLACPIILPDGTTIAGAYRGFGKTVLVKYAPKPGVKGFRTLGPVEGDSKGNIRILD